jgi:hypothetical protein
MVFPKNNKVYLQAQLCFHRYSKEDSFAFLAPWTTSLE